MPNFFGKKDNRPAEVELIALHAELSVTYILENNKHVTCELKRGQLGMIHHLFSNDQDANDFLAFVNNNEFKKDFPDIANARITNLKERPHHAYPNSTKFLIRLSDAQFKKLLEKEYCTIPPSLGR